MYRHLIYPTLQRLEAERTHDATLRLLSIVERSSLARRLTGRMLSVDDDCLDANVAGIRFHNPIGVAAGLDKNAVAVQTWGALGFGHVEIGTVTPQPQLGNPKPRVFRLPEDRALINRMGFPGQGMHVVQSRLSRLRSDRLVVGANLGANKSSVEAGRAAEDYVAVLRCLYQHADYFTINVSSPNTARLRDLQGPEALAALIAQVVACRDGMDQRKPIFLKIAPDLEQHDLEAIVEVCLDQRIDGIIATNTTIARPATLHGTAREQIGGLSGLPLRDRSTEVIRTVHRLASGQLPIIGVGGVFCAADVWDKLCAGASLVQVYTGLIYEGPLMARRIKRELIALLDRHGVRSVSEIAGSGSLRQSERVTNNKGGE